MNTNEDLRTFADGVLIWAASKSDGKLAINKIGTSILDETYDDIDNNLTKDDSTKKNIRKEKGLSTGAKIGIALGVILGVSIIGGAIFILLKFIRNNKVMSEANFQSNENITVYSKNNINKKDLVQK